MHRNTPLHLLSFKINKELKEIYISIFLRSLSFGIITIFIPIYLLKEVGYSLNQVLYFFLLYAVFFAIFSPISAKFSSNFGLKHSILLSVPFYLCFYFLLYTINDYNWSIYFITIVFSFASSLFWIAFHTQFAKFSDHDHRGQEISIWYILVYIFSIFGPLIGGLILTYFNFKFLFIVVGILLLISVLPLFFSSEVYEPAKFSLKFVFNKFKLRDIFATLSYGIESDIRTVILPLFIFYTFADYLSLGFLFTFSIFFIVIFLFFIGKFSDIFDKIKLMKLGAYLLAISLIIIIFAKTWWMFLILLPINGVTFSLFDVSLSAIFYDRALKTRNLVEYLVLREIFTCIGRGILLGLVLLFNSLIYGFIIGALVLLLNKNFKNT